MEEQKCQGCGKKFPQEEMKNIQMKTCCSVRDILVCSSCWQKYHSREQEKK